MKKNDPRLPVLSVFLIGLMCLSAFVPADNPDAIVGIWMTGSRQGHVQIYKRENQYFGKIVWLKEPNDPRSGLPRTDTANPEPQKRNQPLLGLVNLRNFRYDGGNVWDSGKVYDPEIGKEYSCKLTLRNTHTLDVRGYVGISLVGRTDTWQRVK